MSPLARVAGRLRRTYLALGGDGRGWILAAVATGWLLSIGMRLVFPALLPTVRAAFGMDLTTAGVLLTLMWGAYALGQLPGGVLGDRIGERDTMVASMIIGTGTIVVVAASTGIPSFFAGTVLFGLATGLYATTRFTVVTDVYPDRDATALGLTSAAGNVGTAVLPVVAGALAAAVGWRVGFGFAIPAFLVTTVGLWVVVPRVTSERAGGGSPLRAARAVAARVATREMALIGSAMLLMSVIYQGFTGFYPTYLVVEKGLDQGVASTLFGLFFAAGIVVQPLAGTVSDRIGSRATMAGANGLTVFTLAALPFVRGTLPLAVLTVLVALQLGFWPVAQAFAIGSLPAEIQGSGFGLVRTAYLTVAAFGPTLVGALGDAGRFDGAMFLLAGFAGVGALVAVLLPERDGR